VFASELTTMIDAGAGLVVGTVDAQGTPRGVRAWAAWVVDPDAQRLRVVLTGDDREVVANLADGRVALTAADVRTLRSVQMKGRVVAVDEPNAADLELAELQTDRFFVAVSQSDGNPMEMLRLLLPSERVVIEMVVEEQYDQTPGPTAGTAIQAG
jgi:Pyridoxamine 5'-phosphate oxidase